MTRSGTISSLPGTGNSARYKPPRGRSGAAGRRVAPYLFILPFFLLFIPFGAGSIILAVGMAFVDWPLGQPAEFVGFEKFAAVLRDPVFFTGMYNTFRMLVGYLLVLMPLAIFIAVCLMQLGRRTVNVVQLAIFAPITMSLIAVSVIFDLLYDDKVGLLNGLLTLLGMGPVKFLTSADIAPWSIVAMRIWRVIGYYAIMLFAGLQSIPDDLYEAAAIDGAGWWQRLWAITLPLLKPVTMFVLVAAGVGAWEVFAEPNVLTEGGPARATYTAIMYIFDVSFGRFDLGRGAAAAVLLAIAIIATTVLATLVLRGRDQ
jgi:ABC-type sugar transport system permease subunit